MAGSSCYDLAGNLMRQLLGLSWLTLGRIWAWWGQLAQVHQVPVSVLSGGRGHSRGLDKTNENVPYIYIYIYIMQHVHAIVPILDTQ